MKKMGGMHKKPTHGAEGQHQGGNYMGNTMGGGAAGQPKGSAGPGKPCSGAEGQHKAGGNKKASSDKRMGGYAF